MIKPETADRTVVIEAPEDDVALVARAQADSWAFALLYDRYVEAVYRYCHRCLGNREAAEDATSQTFAKALAALPRYRERDGSFRSWLFAIAHNAIADDFRARGPEQSLPPDLDPADGTPTPEELALAREADRTVWDLLAMLPPEQARPLELRLAGLNDAEIARVLGRSHGAVRVAQHRALRRLRALLGAAGKESGDG